jgi:hypothetical protein
VGAAFNGFKTDIGYSLKSFMILPFTVNFSEPTSAWGLVGPGKGGTMEVGLIVEFNAVGGSAVIYQEAKIRIRSANEGLLK